mmetsp:Transcript_33994/g.84723  ORF Transcript_33994/g.84723 Transcript_33994/m.84723 type:complete len:296 (+) Transcript_33994:558-1445(+)
MEGRGSPPLEHVAPRVGSGRLAQLVHTQRRNTRPSSPRLCGGPLAPSASGRQGGRQVELGAGGGARVRPASGVRLVAFAGCGRGEDGGALLRLRAPRRDCWNSKASFCRVVRVHDWSAAKICRRLWHSPGRAHAHGRLQSVRTTFERWLGHLVLLRPAARRERRAARVALIARLGSWGSTTGLPTCTRRLLLVGARAAPFQRQAAQPDDHSWHDFARDSPAVSASKRPVPAPHCEHRSKSAHVPLDVRNERLDVGALLQSLLPRSQACRGCVARLLHRARGRRLRCGGTVGYDLS